MLEPCESLPGGLHLQLRGLSHFFFRMLHVFITNGVSFRDSETHGRRRPHIAASRLRDDFYGNGNRRCTSGCAEGGVLFDLVLLSLGLDLL